MSLRKTHYSQIIKALKPVPVGLALFALLCLMWVSLDLQRQGNLRDTIQSKAEILASLIDSDIRGRIPSLQRIVNRWEIRGGTPKSEFIADAQAFVRDLPGFQGLGWVDSSYHVRWIVPFEGNEEAENLNLAFEERRKIALDTARDKKTPTMTATVNLVQGGNGFIIYFPIYTSSGFDGFLSVVFRTKPWLDYIFETKAPDTNFVVAVSFDNERIYEQHGASETSHIDWIGTFQTRILDHELLVEVLPTSELVAASRSYLPEWAAAMGLLLTGLIVYMLSLYQRAEQMTAMTLTANAALEKEATVRQRAEKALQDSHDALEARVKERTQELIDINADLLRGESIARMGHWTWDVSTQEVTWSPECFSLFGRDPETWVPTGENFRQHMPADDRQRLEEANARGIESGDPFNLQYRYFRGGAPDDTVWIDIHCEFSKNDNGDIVKMIGTAQDVTERKTLEAQLLQSQKMEVVGHLAGGVAHDFNNLLGVMIGNAEMLQNRVEEDEKSRRYVDVLLKAVDRGASLTQRLLAFSRQQSLSPIPTETNALVLGLDDMIQRTLGATIKLSTHLDPETYNLLIDPHQFENALVNLAINARDAMPEGGVLTIETINITLDQAWADQHDEVTPGDYVKVSVSDTGTGMTTDVMKKAFDPFFTTKEVGQGSGLGLSMVYGFVKQSNGHVSIWSKINQGTTIELYLPRSITAAVREETKDDTSGVEPGSERILLVEDDEDLRFISSSTLRKQGYQIVEARDGEEAIRQLQDNQPFDLLFTDVILPGGMNGVEISEKAKTVRPEIKILFTSGFTEDAIAYGSKLDSDETLLKKPYHRADLLQKVRAILDSVTK